MTAGSYAGDYKVANLGASYDFGFVKPMAFYQNDKISGRSTVADFEMNTYAVGIHL